MEEEESMEVLLEKAVQGLMRVNHMTREEALRLMAKALNPNWHPKIRLVKKEKK